MRQMTDTPDQTGTLCLSIVEAVASARGVAPEDFDTPLYEAVDTDALEVLFEQTVSGEERRGWVSFDYCGYRVVVDSDRHVSVEPLGETNGHR